MSAKIPARAIVTRRFNATAERVFDAWLRPDVLDQWMFGPAVRDEEIIHLAVDPRVGGAFSFLVQRGEEEIDHVGKYLELARPRRLVFTWMVVGAAVGSRVLVDIEPHSADCELTLTHELHPDWAHFVSQAETSWSTMLDALAVALDATRAPR